MKDKCPRCGGGLLAHPAISRRDNQTEICSNCGTEEALIDYCKAMKSMSSIPSSAIKREREFKFKGRYKNGTKTKK